MATISNLTIDQGTDFDITVNVDADDGGSLDLTGYTGRAQIRKSYSSLTAIDFTVSIILPTTDGQLRLSLPASTSNTMKPGRYLYDLEIESSTGKVTRVIEGQITITPSITRSDN